MTTRLALLGCASLLLVGCGITARPARTSSKVYPAKPPTCTILFTYFEPNKPPDPERYEQIGLIEVSPLPIEPVYTDEVKRVLRAHACKLGGDIVRYQSRQDTSKRSTAGFTVEVDLATYVPPPPTSDEKTEGDKAAEPALDENAPDAGSRGPRLPP